MAVMGAWSMEHRAWSIFHLENGLRLGDGKRARMPQDDLGGTKTGPYPRKANCKPVLPRCNGKVLLMGSRIRGRKGLDLISEEVFDQVGGVWR